MNLPIRGIMPPVSTIFKPDMTLDRRGMTLLIEHLIKQGVHGLFFMGTAGEFANMSMDLRKEVTRFAVEAVGKRVPVWIGTGANSTVEVEELSRYAENEGADGVIVINPSYYTLGETQLWEHFSRVARSVKLPIMLYNFPMLTGQDLTPEFVKRLATTYSNVVGIKDTVDRLAHMREMIHTVKSVRPDFSVFAGFDEYLADVLILGGDGAIPASSNFAPELTLGIWNAFHKKDMNELIQIQRKLAYIPYMYALDAPFVNVVKEAIRMRGLDISTQLLAPALPLPESKKAELRRILAQAGLMNNTSEPEYVPIF
ncbi:dihydrodipicolinate synthase family protein [Paenibacillus guangzhouensis]|uniref:dihydrodipicolinate synthase family protein n=1 Tax=Paenibacillus guangzhouensis TaxID=1473112 RepID=UPI002AB01C70|nr:dihydrodipicolinate synthase family protein [Paenibacillus guangzhouensis]